MYLRSPATLGYSRPNQPLQRGLYTRRPPLAGLGCNCKRRRAMNGLGDPVSIDSSTLLIAAGIGAVLFFFLGGRATPRIKKRIRRRLHSAAERFA